MNSLHEKIQKAYKNMISYYKQLAKTYNKVIRHNLIKKFPRNEIRNEKVSKAFHN